MFMRDPASDAPPLRHGRLLWGGLAVTAVVTVLFGFLPGIFAIVGDAAKAIAPI
jgi:hypothetical protein